MSKNENVPPMLDGCQVLTFKGEPYYMIDDVADYFGCHKSTIYRKINARKLISVKLGATWIKASSIESLMMDDGR